MTEKKATNVHWHDGEISQTARNSLLVKKTQRSGLRVYQEVVKAQLQLL